MKILGVRIDNFFRKEILEKIGFFLNEDKFHQIATVNPEFILKAQDDGEFAEILNGCDLNVADGVGIWYAFIRNFGFLKSRMAGVELLNEVLKIANKKRLMVFLAVSNHGLSDLKEIRTALEKKYSNIVFDGIEFDRLNFESYEIQNKKYEILLCNFGVPYQEKFLHSLKAQNDVKIRLAMGVGGSFDFITGKIKRAPKILRKIGLEWLWRFALEPRYRAKRIFNAVFAFSVRVLFNK